jgi:nitroreductase
MRTTRRTEAAMPTLPLSPDELLSTTRAVRRRLDLTRPVERELLLECLALAQQAPTGSNRQDWHFVVVTDPAKRAALAELYRRGGEIYRASGRSSASRPGMERIAASSLHLAEHIQEVPVHVIPCIGGRAEGQSVFEQAALWGSILPAAWSFMLAARARGLGTCWTTFHLQFEAEAAGILGIPVANVTQAALIPVAHTIGTDFKPARRAPVETLVHWDAW